MLAFSMPILSGGVGTRRLVNGAVGGLKISKLKLFLGNDPFFPSQKNALRFSKIVEYKMFHSFVLLFLFFFSLCFLTFPQLWAFLRVTNILALNAGNL